jgi:hypothetical protein
MSQQILLDTLPSWLPSDAWAGFLEMRAAIKKKPTARAQQLLLKKLHQMHSAGQDIEAVLDQSTTNNWTDVYPLKQNRLAVAQGMSQAAAVTISNLQAFLSEHAHE